MDTSCHFHDSASFLYDVMKTFNRRTIKLESWELAFRNNHSLALRFSERKRISNHSNLFLVHNWIKVWFYGNVAVIIICKREKKKFATTMKSWCALRLCHAVRSRSALKAACIILCGYHHKLSAFKRHLCRWHLFLILAGLRVFVRTLFFLFITYLNCGNRWKFTWHSGDIIKYLIQMGTHTNNFQFNHRIWEKVSKATRKRMSLQSANYCCVSIRIDAFA